VTRIPSGRPPPSTRRCSLLLSPPRLRPSASSCGCALPPCGPPRSAGVVRRRRAGGRGPRCRPPSAPASPARRGCRRGG
jgi:hypothetical protein